MQQVTASRPPPGLLVAALALTLAFGTTAIAAPETVSNKITKSKVKRIAKKQINKLAPGLSVANAVNADSLGGAPADSYATRLFARVDYDDSTPEVLAQSGGIAGSGEAMAGFPQLTFPRDMTNCAIMAMPVSLGGLQVIRQSAQFSSGSLVTLVISDTTAPVRTDFSVVGVC